MIESEAMEQKTEASQAVSIEFALRQIIEADDNYALTQQLIDIGRAALKAQPAPTEAPKWTKQPPTAQADYWNWNGNEDDAPTIVSVLYSPSGHFVASIYIRSGQAEMCHTYGGWWMRIEQPGLPGEAGHTGAAQGLSPTYAWLERSTRNSPVEVENAARTMMAFYQGAEFPEAAQGEDSARLELSIDQLVEIGAKSEFSDPGSGDPWFDCLGFARDVIAADRALRARASDETGGVKS